MLTAILILVLLFPLVSVNIVTAEEEYRRFVDETEEK